MQEARPAVSVIIPTYNESLNIGELIERLEETLKSTSHEIIVVDDNSPDKTWEIAEGIAETNTSLRVIRRIKERGLSSAVVTGMEVAAGRTFAVMDADLQHDEKILPQMVETILKGEADVCIGSRATEGGSYGEWSRMRRFVSWVAALMAKIMLPVNVKDPMSGFFVVSRGSFHEVVDSINPRGFKILLEFIGRHPNLKIKEIGYTFRNRARGETKLSGSVIKNYLIALYDLRFGRFISPTFIQYAFVGSTGVVINLIGFAIGEWLGFPRVYTGISPRLDPLYLSVPFGMQIAIITNYLMNNYITFYELRHRGSMIVRGFIIFEIVSIVGLVMQTGVFQLLHTNGFLSGLLVEGVRKYVNNGLGIIFATISNYYLNLNFTWEKQ
ncbi:MAG: glycosyltransferase family 2 protein [Spirochaetia bacterium]|nr:glycosyltransferase family 2 protein [Spirochaetia bacterium]